MLLQEWKKMEVATRQLPGEGRGVSRTPRLTGFGEVAEALQAKSWRFCMTSFEALTAGGNQTNFAFGMVTN